MTQSTRRIHKGRRQACAGLAALGLAPWAQAMRAEPAQGRAARPYRVAARQADRAQLAEPCDVQLSGWLGARVALNASQRLLNVDTEPLLAGFKHKPGSHPWIGEHVGKWLHAATLAWSNSGDAALRRKLDQVAAELVAAQEADGYLGTYLPAQRLALHDGADWDVWSHKYALIGLLTYHRHTGDAAALQACRRAADLLLATFPRQRSILAAGTHLGMAATSVLEPMVQLHRATADPRYLAFARYLVQAWDEPGGPGILKALLQGKPLPQVANGKAYEMLSNLVGLAELVRVTGEPPLRQALLQALLTAWQDVVDKRLYATGTTSQAEYFQPDHDLRDGVPRHVGETCVTTTWIQLNLLLLQITGGARFGDELERSFYNHLTAAQHPAGNDWCYFTALDGRKQYDQGITCCHSSGPRGLALAPQAAYLTAPRRAGAAVHDVLLVSTFETSRATLLLAGQAVTVEQEGGFPYQGQSVLTLRMARPARFALKWRAPAWALPLKLDGAQLNQGWAELPPRLWKDGDQLRLAYRLAARTLTGEATHAGRAALTWGPFVLAYEQQDNPGQPSPPRLGLMPDDQARARPVAGRLQLDAAVLAFQDGTARRLPAHFRSFADAGADRGRFRVWLHAPGVAPPAAPQGASLLLDGEESRSRDGNGPGSINDGDLTSLANTYDGTAALEDWFAVTLEQPAVVSRVVFLHGRNYHDGGWFDTAGGPPQVQVQREAGAPWATVGVLADYPATTSSDSSGLSPGQPFELRLPEPVRLVAVRVIGKPASGDRPAQAFATCTQLQAF